MLSKDVTKRVENNRNRKITAKYAEYLNKRAPSGSTSLRI